MIRVRTRLLTFTLVAVAAAAVVSAQKPYVATYDAARSIRLQGAITRIEWVNPRAFLFIDVKDPTGIVTNWAIEFGNPLELESRGWNRKSVQIGEVVRVDGILARGDSPHASAKSIVVTRTGRDVFSAAPKRVVSVALKRPAPRWPDGQVRLGPEPGKKGYWAEASSRTLVDATAG